LFLGFLQRQFRFSHVQLIFLIRIPRKQILADLAIQFVLLQLALGLSDRTQQIATLSLQIRLFFLNTQFRFIQSSLGFGLIA
jgi:hypothetical protein